VDEGCYWIKLNKHIYIYGINLKNESEYTNTINLYNENIKTKCFRTQHKLIYNIPLVTFNDSIIFLGNRNIIVAFNNDKIFFEHYNPSTILSSLFLKDDKLYVGTRNEGAGMFMYNTNKIFNYEPLIKEYTAAIFNDREDNIWITTLENGVFCIPAYRFTVLNGNSPLNGENVTILNAYNNGLITGIASGKLFFYNGQFKELTLPECNFYAFGDVIVTAKNRFILNIHTSFNDMIVIYNGLQPEKSIPVQASIKKMSYSEKDNRLYMATHNQLSYMDMNTDNYQIVTLTNNRINTVYNHNNNLLYGTPDGLYLFDTKKKYTSELIKGKRIDAICEIKNGIVAGSNGFGIFILLHDTIININSRNGLSGDFIRFLKWDSIQNILWAGTSNALSQINFSNLSEGDYDIKILNFRSGLNSNIINNLEILNDTIYISGNQGITLFPKHKLNKKLELPFLYISSITFNDKNVVQEDHNIFRNVKHNNIEVQLDIISYSFTGGITIYYRLTGLPDTSWKSTREQNIRLASLPPGSYKLELKAGNSSGSYSNITNWNFSIVKPFWQQTWFIIILILLLLLLISIIAVLRIKKIKKQIKLKELLLESELKGLRAQMNPHFIFNALSSIQSYILKNDTQNADYYISRFAKLIRMILESSRQNVIPLSDEVNILKLYAELENLRLSDKFDFVIDTSRLSDPDTNYIPPMLIQPIVENAIWHGIAHLNNKRGKVTVTFSEENNLIKCIIEDNGIGREQAMKLMARNNYKTSMGYQITKQRIELKGKKGSSVTTEDLYDSEGNNSGTRITLIF